MKKKVGSFKFKLEVIDLYATSGGDGSVVTRTGKPVAIEIGIERSWEKVLATLLHEIIEYAYLSNSCRYRQDPDYTSSLAGVTFFLTHEQFDQALDQSSEFLVDAIPALAKVHAKRKKQ